MNEIDYVDGLIKELEIMRQHHEAEYAIRILDKINRHVLTVSQMKRIQKILNKTY